MLDTLKYLETQTTWQCSPAINAACSCQLSVHYHFQLLLGYTEWCTRHATVLCAACATPAIHTLALVGHDYSVGMAENVGISKGTYLVCEISLFNYCNQVNAMWNRNWRFYINHCTYVCR